MLRYVVQITELNLLKNQKNKSNFIICNGLSKYSVSVSVSTELHVLVLLGPQVLHADWEQSRSAASPDCAYSSCTTGLHCGEAEEKHLLVKAVWRWEVGSPTMEKQSLSSLTGDNLNGEMLRASTTGSEPLHLHSLGPNQRRSLLKSRVYQKQLQNLGSFAQSWPQSCSTLVESAVGAGLFWLTCDERWLKKKTGCGLTAAELVMRRCRATVEAACSLHMQLRMMFVQWINCAIATNASRFFTSQSSNSPNRINRLILALAQKTWQWWAIYCREASTQNQKPTKPHISWPLFAKFRRWRNPGVFYLLWKVAFGFEEIWALRLFTVKQRKHNSNGSRYCYNIAKRRRVEGNYRLPWTKTSQRFKADVWHHAKLGPNWS